MLKQAEKWFPDLGTMVSGHLLIYVISAKVVSNGSKILI